MGTIAACLARAAGSIAGEEAGGGSRAGMAMNVREPMAAPIIRQLKRWTIPSNRGDRPIILDASPGTACPVVEAMLREDTVDTFLARAGADWTTVHWLAAQH